MTNIIRIPASVCPLHLWHEYFFNELMDKTWEKILIALQWWEKIIQNLTKNFWQNPTNPKIQELLKKSYEQNNFLNINDRKEIIQNFNNNIIISENSFINNLNINDFIWNAIWSDLLYRFCNTLNNKDKLKNDKILKFKKLYIIEREWYPIPKNYKNLIEKTWYEIDVEIIWKSNFNISWTDIRKIYQKEWLKWIKKYVSKNTYDILQNIKN